MCNNFSLSISGAWLALCSGLAQHINKRLVIGLITLSQHDNLAFITASLYIYTTFMGHDCVADFKLK